MITILKRIFIKNDDMSSAYTRKRYAMLCSIVGIILNLFMFIGKSLAGTISGSVAITADAYNNLGDAVTNIEVLWGFYMAGIGAGKHHPGGHGRTEWLVALLAGYAVFTMGIHQLVNSIQAIRNPSTGEFSAVIICVLLCSIGIKLYMWFYNKQIGKTIDSLSMRAVATDCITDVASTVVVLLNVIIEHFSGWHIDGWCGLLVSGLIIYSGWGALAEAITTILGKGGDREFTKKIESVVKKYKVFTGINSLMVHDYGAGRRFVSFYVEGSEEEDLTMLYNEADKIGLEISEEFSCEAIVGVNIMIRDQQLLNKVHDEIEIKVHELCNYATIEEFKMIKYLDHIDIVVVIGILMNNNSKSEEFCKELKEYIKQINKNYIPVVKTLIVQSERVKGRRYKRKYQ